MEALTVTASGVSSFGSLSLLVIKSRLPLMPIVFRLRVCALPFGIQWTSDRPPLPHSNVCIDHCGAYIFVSEQLLDCPDIRPLFKVMRCEAVAECMAACWFRNPCAPDGAFHRALKD
jgi:hypothetical protein